MMIRGSTATGTDSTAPGAHQYHFGSTVGQERTMQLGVAGLLVGGSTAACNGSITVQFFAYNNPIYRASIEGAFLPNRSLKFEQLSPHHC